MSSPSIAIGISTKNRPNSFCELSSSILQNTSRMSGHDVFVVDDASDTDYSYPDFRFDKSAGISAVKNKCLQLCYESGADHFFLLDDDVRILKSDWWKPYVNSGEHHLCATFLPQHRTFTTIRPVNDELWESEFKTHLLGNGYCLYFTRKCIETVGGFDTNYNNKYEHCCLSRRIFNAGLTKHIYQDVINSNELIYCLDQDNAIQRSFTPKEMQDNLKSGYDYFRSQEKSKAFIPFIT